MKNFESGQLEEHLGYLLRYLSNRVSESLADRLSAYDVSVAQWFVLRSLYDVEDASLNQLAKSVCVDNGSMSRMMERLFQKGLIVREAHPTDRRSVRLRLSHAGKALVPLMAKEADRHDEAFFGVIGEDDRRRLLELVKSLLTRIGWQGKASE